MTAISINALTETLLDFYLGDAESSKDEDHGSTLHFLSPSVGSSKTTAKPAIYGINWLFADQIAGGRWWLRRCGGYCRNGS